MRAVLRQVQKLVARNEEMHLRRRFGVRRHLEFEFDSVDAPDVAGRHDQVGRPQQRHRTRRHRLAEAAIDLPARALCQQRPELVLRAPQHRGAGDDVLRNRMLHEKVGRDDRNAAVSQCAVHGAEKAARRLVEIARIGKRQRLQRRRMLRDHGRRGVLRGFPGCFSVACLGHLVLAPSRITIF